MTEQERIQIIEEFVEFCGANLKIDELPKMTFIDDKSWVLTNHSFGQYKNDSRHITVYIANRNLADTLRTVAHELTHHKQNELGLLYNGAGETGSPIENEANSVAGMLMRSFGQKHEIIYESIKPQIIRNLIKELKK
jgi:Zn-dependent peptidase ImmA (M78 family)